MFEYSQQTPVAPQPVEKEQTSEPPSKKRKNFSLLCEEDEVEQAEVLSNSQIIISELNMYTSLKNTVTDTSCPLKFYQLNKDNLPNLANIAKMLFCTTASSVPSECLFSKSGELISKKRTRLNPVLAEDLLILGLNKFD